VELGGQNLIFGGHTSVSNTRPAYLLECSSAVLDLSSSMAAVLPAVASDRCTEAHPFPRVLSPLPATR
jgi:hypothetical protein